MVASNRQTIAIAGDYPDIEFRVGELETGRDCRGAAMDRVKAIGLDVIGQARGTTDPGYEYSCLRASASVSQRAGDRFQYGVITTTRAPANFFRTRKVFSC